MKIKLKNLFSFSEFPFISFFYFFFFLFYLFYELWISGTEIGLFFLNSIIKRSNWNFKIYKSLLSKQEECMLDFCEFSLVQTICLIVYPIFTLILYQILQSVWTTGKIKTHRKGISKIINNSSQHENKDKMKITSIPECTCYTLYYLQCYSSFLKIYSFYTGGGGGNNLVWSFLHRYHHYFRK